MATSHLLTADKTSYRVMYKIYGQNMFLDSFPRALLHEIGMEKSKLCECGKKHIDDQQKGKILHFDVTDGRLWCGP